MLYSLTDIKYEITNGKKMYLIFEFVDFDLKKYMDSKLIN